MDNQSPFDKRLDDMLKDCETVILGRENEIKERLFKAKRNAPDSPVVEFWQAELDALKRLRQRVSWYRKTGTMLNEDVK